MGFQADETNDQWFRKITFYMFIYCSINKNLCLGLYALFCSHTQKKTTPNSIYYAMMCLYIRVWIRVFGWQQYPGTMKEQISAEPSGIKAIQDIFKLLGSQFGSIPGEIRDHD